MALQLGRVVAAVVKAVGGRTATLTRQRPMFTSITADTVQRIADEQVIRVVPDQVKNFNALRAGTLQLAQHAAWLVPAQGLKWPPDAGHQLAVGPLMLTVVEVALVRQPDSAVVAYRILARQ